MLGGLACWRLVGLPEYGAARTVMAFASFRGELDTRPLLFDILRSGRTLVLPAVQAGTPRLDLRIVSDLAELRPGGWGIPEPGQGCPPADPARIDLVVVPGVAFDVRGQRVGYGGGFYDALLRGWREEPGPAARRPAAPGAAGRHSAGPVACGLAYELQVHPAVPAGPHDQPLDLLVTELRIRRFAKGDMPDGRGG